MRTTRRAGAALLLTAVLAAAGACGSSGSGGSADASGSQTPAPTATTTTGPTGTTSAPPSSGTSASDASTASPDVELSGVPEVSPASGPTVEVDGLSVRMPAGYVVDRQQSSGRIAFADHPGDQLMTVSLVPSAGLSIPLAEGRRDYVSDLPGPKLSADDVVLVDGKKWWHVAATTGNSERVDAYGTTTPDFEVYLEVHGLRVELSAAQATRLTASMLPTVRFTG